MPRELKLKNLLIFLSVFSFSLVSNAFESLEPQTITAIDMGWSSEGIYIHTKELYTSKDNCGGTAARMPFDHPMFKENLAVFLSAFHANSKVRLVVDGCISTAMWLKAVRIEK